jgi:hypothetical protein
MKYMSRIALVCTLAITTFLAACSGEDNNPTKPMEETEIVQCITSINGETVHDGSKLIIATIKKSTSPQEKDAFMIFGYSTTDISPKTRVDDCVGVLLNPVTGVGSYKVSYPFGSSFAISLNGISYVSLQGTIIVTRYDAVGGWVEGTFEGNANSIDGRVSITVIRGVFKVKRDADGVLG